MKLKSSLRLDQMRFHIESHRSSGLSVVAYCKQHNLVKSNFYYWLKKLSKASKPVSFVPITVDPLAADSTVEVHFPSGVYVVFSGSVKASLLKEVVCCI